MFGDQHRTITGGGMDSMLLIAAEADTILLFASQVPDPMCDISGSGEVQAVVEVSKDERLYLWSVKGQYVERSVCLDATQALPGHILQHFSVPCQEYLL